MGLKLNDKELDYGLFQNINGAKSSLDKINYYLDTLSIQIDIELRSKLINLQSEFSDYIDKIQYMKDSISDIIQNLKNAESQNVDIADSLNSNYSSNSDTSSSTNNEQYEDANITETEIIVPEGLGDFHTYMGWSSVNIEKSDQYKLREDAGENYDSEGFATINGRYVIACTSTFGNVGDYVDFYQTDGNVIKCVIGDIKNPNDADCTEWGHSDGNCIIEFIVNTELYCSNFYDNPGTVDCHPEWNYDIDRAVNLGSYYENPTFGADTSE